MPKIIEVNFNDPGETKARLQREKHSQPKSSGRFKAVVDEYLERVANNPEPVSQPEPTKTCTADPGGFDPPGNSGYTCDTPIF